MKRRLMQILVFVMLFGAFPLFPNPINALELRLMPNGRLTLDARDVPLQEILYRISAAGVNVRIDPDIRANVTASYKNTEIRHVFDAILGDYNHALIWDRCAECRENEYTLVEIQIFKPGAKDRLKQLSATRGFDIIQDPKTGAFYVRNEILVRPSSDAARAELEKLVASIGGAIIGPNQGGIYRVILPDGTDLAGFMELLKQKGIDGAEPNYAYRLTPPMAGTDSAAISPVVRKNGISGKIPPVAVFDSGLSPDLLEDPYILGSLNAVDPRTPVSDPHGHGTQMAMIASGAVDPLGSAAGPGGENVPVIAIQGFDENGFTSNDTLMRGIDYAIANGARVLSLSWHALSESAFLGAYLEEAGKKGMIVVAAAGNEPTGKPVYPAAFPGVVGVGALNPDGGKWPESNFGDFVDVQALGVANLPTGYEGPPGTYAGTSISTAYTARRIAAYLGEHPDAGSEEIVKFLGK